MLLRLKNVSITIVSVNMNMHNGVKCKIEAIETVTIKKPLISKPAQKQRCYTQTMVHGSGHFNFKLNWVLDLKNIALGFTIKFPFLLVSQFRLENTQRMHQILPPKPSRHPNITEACWGNNPPPGVRAANRTLSQTDRKTRSKGHESSFYNNAKEVKVITVH